MGTRQERAPRPETSVPTVDLDPRVVVRGLISRHIVNPDLLLKGARVGEFDPDWYASQPAEVVLVGTSAKNAEYRPYNGFNRIDAAVKHVNTLVEQAQPGTEPDTTIPFNDVTKKLLEGNKYRDKAKARGYLTPGEWSSEVVDSTIVNGEHRFRRVATVLMDEWNRKMGEDADELTALAAVSILGRSNLKMNTLDKAVIHKAIESNTHQFFGGETAEQRGKIKEGLLTMADIVIDSKLGYSEINAAAFEVATGLFEDIGPEERERQIRGLVRLPSAHAKAMGVAPRGGEARLVQMGDALLVRFGSLRDKKYAASDALRIKYHLEDAMLYGQLLTKLDPETFPPQVREKKTTAGPSHPGTPPSRMAPEFRPPGGTGGTGPEQGRGMEHVVVSTARILQRHVEQLPKKSIVSPDVAAALKQLRATIDTALGDGVAGDAKDTKSEPSPIKSGTPGRNGTTYSERLRRFVKGGPKTIELMEGIAAQVDAARERGDSIPKLVEEYPDELFVDAWQPHGASIGRATELEVSGGAQTKAKEICVGCPVRTICLATELREEDQNFVRGGMTDRERRALKKDTVATATFLEDVEKARVYHTTLMGKMHNQR